MRQFIWEAPLKPLAAGDIVRHVSPALGARIRRFEVDVTPDAGWPAAGSGDVLEMRMERSADRGRTWTPTLGVIWGDASKWKSAVATAHHGAGHAPHEGALPIEFAFEAREIFRFMFKALQACAPKIELFGVP